MTSCLPQQAEEEDDHTQPLRKLVAFLLRKLRRMMITLRLKGEDGGCAQEAEEGDRGRR